MAIQQRKEIPLNPLSAPQQPVSKQTAAPKPVAPPKPKPAPAALQKAIDAISPGKRGRKPTGKARVLVSVRLDPDIAQALKSASDINSLLREALKL